MGIYLSSYLGRCRSTANATLQPPARARRTLESMPSLRQRRPDQIRDPGSHPKRRRWVPTQPQPALSGGDCAESRGARMCTVCRHFPSQPPGLAAMGLDVSGTPKSMLKQQLWYPRRLQRVQSPVTIKITPPGSKPNFYICPPPEEPPDPCAKETVLKALSQCNKGKRKFDEPLWFEIPDHKRSRLSAFRPVVRHGESLPLVPRPGRLRRAPLL